MGLLRLARWVGASVLVVAVVVTVSSRLGGSVRAVGPGMVEVGFRPTWTGQTTLAFPPIGEVSSATHRGPVDLRIELRSLDVSRLVGSDGTVDGEEIRRTIERDLRASVWWVILRFVVVGALAGLVTVAALPRRSARGVAAGAVGGAVLNGLLVLSILPGFDADRFAELTYSGPLSAGGEVLGSLTSAGGPVGQRVASLADRLADLYSSTLTGGLDRAPSDVVILHISDLHLNPLGARLARDLATAFDVDAVLDTGDTTSFGSDFEGAYADLLADFPVPYLFVAGNHDSTTNRTRIAATRGVTALHDTAVDIKGLRIAGFDDPVITTGAEVPRAERVRRELAATPAVRRLLERERPDVLAVHNSVILQGVVGEVPTALAGHLHATKFGASKGTVISVVGSTGATGLGSLLVNANLPATAAILRFRDGRLSVIDSVEVIGTSGDMVIRRRIVTDADREAETAGFIDTDVDERPGLPPGDVVTTAPVPESVETSTTTSGG